MGDLFPLHPLRTVSTILTQCAQVIPSTDMAIIISLFSDMYTMGIESKSSPPPIPPPEDSTAEGCAPLPPPECANCVAARLTLSTIPGKSGLPGTHLFLMLIIGNGSAP